MEFQPQRQEERENLEKERSLRRKKILESGIDQKARDPEHIQAAIDRLDKKRKEGRITTDAGSEDSVVFLYDDYVEENPEQAHELQSILNKYPLLNLGCGEYGAIGWRGELELKQPQIMVDAFLAPAKFNEYARKLRVAGDDINKRSRPDLFGAIEYEEGKYRKESDMRTFFKRSDMLSFLNQVPDGYGNITMNSIDDYVVEDNEYEEMLASQIERVLPDDGIYMACHTPWITAALIRRGFIDVTDIFMRTKEGKSHGSITVLQKPVDLLGQERQQ